MLLKENLGNGKPPLAKANHRGKTQKEKKHMDETKQQMDAKVGHQHP